MRVAILISSPVKSGSDDGPRQDYVLLAEALDAALITPIRCPPRGMIGKALRIFRSAWAAFRERRNYDMIIADIDRAGIILALLFKITGASQRLVTICHGKIVRPLDRRLIRLLNLQTHMHRLVCYGPRVAREARAELGMTERQVPLVRHPADHRFWRPDGTAPERLIVAAGMFHRDYPTLISAIEGMDVRLVIAASSPWMAEQGISRNGSLPPNVDVARCSYTELRDLYARAALIAVPLESNMFQSGSLVVYEAMAMGKPVIITRSEGQDELALVTDGETGYYVPPGDSAAWRRKIEHLLGRPDEAERMGRKAREIVDGGLNMDGYVASMVAVVHSLAAEVQAIRQA